MPSNRRPDRIEVDPLDEQYTRVRLVVGTLDVTSSVANFAWHESVGRSLAKWFPEHWSATGELELDAGGFGALSALAASSS